MKAKSISLFSCLLGASCLLCVVPLILLTPSSEGAVPQPTNYQGMLKDTAAIPCEVDATLSIGANAGSLTSADIRFLVKSLIRDAQDVQSENKIIMYRGKIPIEVDYDKGVLIIQGREIPIIVDGDVEITDPRTKDWVNLSYDRFEVYIEPGFYADNTDELNLYFDRFEPRYELMESLTGWSSEEFYNEKLNIYVEEDPDSCGHGWAIGGESHVFLRHDLSNPDVCKGKYYIDGIGYYDVNPGQLGDQWKYMALVLHESLHGITPLPFYPRVWLAEGWAEYYQLNVLSTYEYEGTPDINQETADHYLYVGYETPAWYSWELYVGNDYHDTSPYQREIQESAGYDITAWMLSMLRDGNYSGGEDPLPWENFYNLIDNNPETLDKSMDLGDYYTDTHVIDLFERATSVVMYPVFRYDGPSGPGWGVRNWTDLDWYADLTPVLQVSDTIQVPQATVSLDATIYNNGDVSLNDVPVRFYSNDSLINEQTADVDSNDSVIVSTQYSALEGVYHIRVAVDEDDLKIETDDSNNQDTATVSFTAIRGDANGDAIIDVGDVVYVVSYLYKNGPAPDPLDAGDANCDAIVNVGDIVYLVSYLYKGGPPPGCP